MFGFGIQNSRQNKNVLILVVNEVDIPTELDLMSTQMSIESLRCFTSGLMTKMLRKQLLCITRNDLICLSRLCIIVLCFGYFLLFAFDLKYYDNVIEIVAGVSRVYACIECL